MMTNEKILKALKECEALLLSTDHERQSIRAQCPSNVFLPTDQQVDAHLLYMIEECKNLLSEGRREKVMRWLGFIQGAMWVVGCASIEDLKNANKPDTENPEQLELPLDPSPEEPVQYVLTKKGEDALDSYYKNR